MFKKFKKNRLYYITLFIILIEQIYIVLFLFFSTPHSSAIFITVSYIFFDIFTFIFFSYIYTLSRYKQDTEFYQYAPKPLQYVHRVIPLKVKNFLFFIFLPFYENYFLRPLLRSITAIKIYFGQPADAFFVLAVYNLFTYLGIIFVYFLTSGDASPYGLLPEIFPMYVIGQMVLVYLVCRKPKF